MLHVLRPQVFTNEEDKKRVVSYVKVDQFCTKVKDEVKWGVGGGHCNGCVLHIMYIYVHTLLTGNKPRK